MGAEMRSFIWRKRHDPKRRSWTRTTPPLCADAGLMVVVVVLFLPGWKTPVSPVMLCWGHCGRACDYWLVIVYVRGVVDLDSTHSDHRKIKKKTSEIWHKRVPNKFNKKSTKQVDQEKKKKKKKNRNKFKPSSRYDALPDH
jgi:hypothetical protein